MFPKSRNISNNKIIGVFSVTFESEFVNILRPIAWGFIAMIGGGVLWVMFSVIAGVSMFASGHADPEVQALMYLFGILFFFSLPVAIVAEIVRYAKRRRQGHVEPVFQQPINAPTIAPKTTSFCPQCGTALQKMGMSGRKICSKCNAIYV